jgi:putative restriction endonuclease
VGVTDGDWFSFLRALRPDEVNFWQPSGGRPFNVLQPGEPFLFKLHSPENFIVGGGFFVRHTALPFSLAWSAFGEKNGVASAAEFRARIQRYRRGVALEPDPIIGCSILAQPFFWPKEQWIPIPASFALNIVQGKSYNDKEDEGRTLWNEVLGRFVFDPNLQENQGEGQRYGAEYLARARLGQGAFRVLVTDAYQKRCAVTGERTLPVLEAAHIRPFFAKGPHRVSNGLLLRSDLHILFDRGYVTVTPDLEVHVSKRIREEFENGREYYAHHGKRLAVVPSDAPERPAAEFLRWHNENCYERGGFGAVGVSRGD